MCCIQTYGDSLSRNLSDEQHRHVRENMTEEELVIFDILTRPSPELSPEERNEVKKVAKGMSEGQLRDFATKPKHYATPFRHRKGPL